MNAAGRRRKRKRKSAIISAEIKAVLDKRRTPLDNTFCPKMGAMQWTCTKDECTCHLKETIPVPRKFDAALRAVIDKRPPETTP